MLLRSASLNFGSDDGKGWSPVMRAVISEVVNALCNR